MHRSLPWPSRMRAWLLLPIALALTVAAAGGCVPPGPPQTPPGVARHWAASLKGHNQVIVVTGIGPNSSVNTVTMWTRRAAGWAKAGSWAGHNGHNGWTNAHRQGDGRSPIGVFGLTDAGGFAANPGTRLPYERSLVKYSYLQRGVRVFNYVVAINYNRLVGTPPSDPTRPLGQAAGGGIWFHVDNGAGTAACVSIPNSAMAYVLRWLDPAARPVMLMGPAASVTR